VENAISKGDQKQRPDRRSLRLGGANGRGHFAIKFRLFCQDPTDNARELRLGASWARAAERRLRHQGVNDAVEHQDAHQGGGTDHKAAREAATGVRPHGQSTMILLANIAP
jgi:hypothetical protein